MYVQKVRACKCPAILCHTLPFYSSSDCLLFPVFTWHRSHSPLTQEDSTKSHPTTTGSHLCVALWAMEIYKLNKQFIWNLTLRNKYTVQKGQYNNENSFIEGQQMGETQPTMVYMKSCHADIHQAGCGPQAHTSGSWQSLA